MPLLRHLPLRSTLIALVLAGTLSGCPASDDPPEDTVRKGPVTLAGGEGAVCGMFVSEQPAPRAQIIHRDGTRLFLCGIADLLIHLEARSPHGAPLEIYVEAMEIDEDPREIQLHEHQWIRAEEAIYRIGDERPPLIMGEPVMVYRDRAAAARGISHGPTETFDFESLKTWWRARQP